MSKLILLIVACAWLQPLTSPLILLTLSKSINSCCWSLRTILPISRITFGRIPWIWWTSSDLLLLQPYKSISPSFPKSESSFPAHSNGASCSHLYLISSTLDYLWKKQGDTVSAPFFKIHTASSKIADTYLGPNDVSQLKISNWKPELIVEKLIQ